MSKNYQKGFGPLAIIIIIAIIAAIGGGVYVASKKSAPQANTEEAGANADVSANANASAGTSGTLRSLLALGQDVTCGINNTDGKGGTIAGAVYISGTMMRGDFTTQSSTKNSTESHMIRNGDTVYAWSGVHGAKMTMANTSGANASTQSNVNLDQKVSYTCKPWKKDASAFAVPTGVNFVDINEVMKMKLPVNVNTTGKVY